MIFNADITLERAREVFHYDENTGALTWAMRPAFRCHIGDIAGGIDNKGYCSVKIDGKSYKHHRLIWFLTIGAWPSGEIDHINGIPTDNRWANLREATHAQNMQNQRRAMKKNSSGFLGVSRRKDRKDSWRAQIEVNGKNKSLGCFRTPELAHIAYVEAKRKLHPRGTL